MVSSYRSRIAIVIGVRCDYDPTTTYRARLLTFDAIRREQKISMSVFRRSRVVVVSQSYCNCNHGLTQLCQSTVAFWRCAVDSTDVMRFTADTVTNGRGHRRRSICCVDRIHRRISRPVSGSDFDKNVCIKSPHLA